MARSRVGAFLKPIFSRRPRAARRSGVSTAPYRQQSTARELNDHATEAKAAIAAPLRQRRMDEQISSPKRKKRPATASAYGDAAGAARESRRAADPTLLSIVRLVELQTAPQQPGLPDLASSLPATKPVSARHKIALVLAEFIGPNEKRQKS